MNHALRECILRHGFTGTPAEIAAALNQKTIQVPMSGRKTWSDIAAELGPEKTQQFYATLERLGLDWVRETLAGSGIDFSHPQVQAMLDRFRADGVITDDEAVILRGLGIKTISPYEQIAGEGQVVTEQQVAEAMTPVQPDGEQRMLSVVVQPNNRAMATLVIQPTYQGRPYGQARVRQYVGDEAASLRQLVRGMKVE